MPLVRIGGGLCYFAHVPKCAGQSVERYLVERFGTLALLDDGYADRSTWQRWSRSSPQHIAATDVARLIPSDWIVSSFAVVRHPVARFASAYNYQSVRLHHLPPGTGPEAWLDTYLSLREHAPNLFDNHLRPQSSIVPEGALAFRLEEGLAPLVAHLDRLAGGADGPREIPRENALPGAAARDHRTEPLSDRLSDRLSEIYRSDFERFGYDPGAPLPDLSVHIPTAESLRARPDGALLRHRSRLGNAIWRIATRLGARYGG